MVHKLYFPYNAGKIDYSQNLTRGENDLIILIRELCWSIYHTKYGKEVNHDESEKNVRIVIDFILKNADMLKILFDASDRNSQLPPQSDDESR